MQHVNSLAGNLDANEVLVEAERLYKKYLLRTDCINDDDFKIRMAAIEAKIRPPQKTTPINIFDAVRSG